MPHCWPVIHPIMSPSSLSLSLSLLLCHLHLLCTNLTSYEQLLIAERYGAVAHLSQWWCWVLGCTHCHSVTIIRGCICDAPHEQLLMDMWWVLMLVHCALGKVGGHQCEVAGKRGGVHTCPIWVSQA